jgi:hypothetical protein
LLEWYRANKLRLRRSAYGTRMASGSRTIRGGYGAGKGGPSGPQWNDHQPITRIVTKKLKKKTYKYASVMDTRHQIDLECKLLLTQIV